MAFWRHEFSEVQICFILEQLRKMRVQNNDGSISLKVAGDDTMWLAILVSAIGLEVRTDAIRNRIANAALFSSDLPIDYSKDDFQKLVYKLLHKFQNVDLRIYRVAFPIWNLPNFLRGIRKMGDVTLNFSPSQNTQIFKTINQQREVQQTDRQYETLFTKDRLRDLRQCTLCLATVQANSPADANEMACQALYVTLGLVNLAVDGGKYWRESFRTSGRLPVSEVLIGPHTTTHFENGKLSGEGFWYEEWVGGPRSKARSTAYMDAWEKRFQQLVKGVAGSKWENKCKSAAARYFKAFSNPNLEESFLEGWRLFENISGSREEKIKEKIRRASNIFNNDTEHNIIGQHLALRRNLLAHGHAINAGDEETLAFQMLRFVAPFLERYILNGFRFDSTKQFWEFLSLPAQKQERVEMRLKCMKQLDLLTKAAKFRLEEK